MCTAVSDIVNELGVEPGIADPAVLGNTELPPVFLQADFERLERVRGQEFAAPICCDAPWTARRYLVVWEYLALGFAESAGVDDVFDVLLAVAFLLEEFPDVSD